MNSVVAVDPTTAAKKRCNKCKRMVTRATMRPGLDKSRHICSMCARRLCRFKCRACDRCFNIGIMQRRTGRVPARCPKCANPGETPRQSLPSAPERATKAKGKRRRIKPDRFASDVVEVGDYEFVKLLDDGAGNQGVSDDEAGPHGNRDEDEVDDDDDDIEADNDYEAHWQENAHQHAVKHDKHDKHVSNDVVTVSTDSEIVIEVAPSTAIAPPHAQSQTSAQRNTPAMPSSKRLTKMGAAESMQRKRQLRTSAAGHRLQAASPRSRGGIAKPGVAGGQQTKAKRLHEVADASRSRAIATPVGRAGGGEARDASLLAAMQYGIEAKQKIGCFLRECEIVKQAERDEMEEQLAQARAQLAFFRKRAKEFRDAASELEVELETSGRQHRQLCRNVQKAIATVTT